MGILAITCTSDYNKMKHIIIASNVAVQRLLVQQPVQQRRRKTADFGDTLRTPDPGMKHAEDVSERWQTRSSVSRMRYSHQMFAPPSRLKPRYKRLEQMYIGQRRGPVQQRSKHASYSRIAVRI
jgi:hypothetical protein